MIEQKELFAAALGLRKPWTLENVEFDPLKGQLDIYIEKIRNEKVECPVCHKECYTHDSKKRTWRHLNFFQHEAYIHCKVPRSKCDEHGVKQVEVPWARPGSGFTLLFEAFMMQLIPHMPVKAAAEQANIYSDVLWRMIDHYVSEAYEEVDMSDVENIGIDETSNKRGHNYVTTFVDMNKSKVIFATEGKDSKTVEKFAEELEKHDGNTEKIENISCDMSKAFRKGIRENFDESKVTYDQFHVIKLANSAVNEVRKIESKINELLKGTRYIWLKNPENLTIDQEKMMKALSKTNLKTERAYRIKRTLQEFYTIAKEDSKAAEEHLKKWYFWATHSRLDPIIKVAKTIKNHWDGILKYTESKITNGVLEGLNSKIQATKRHARGYGTTKHFISIIYLICGDLNLNIDTNLL